MERGAGQSERWQLCRRDRAASRAPLLGPAGTAGSGGQEAREGDWEGADPGVARAPSCGHTGTHARLGCHPCPNTLTTWASSRCS